MKIDVTKMCRGCARNTDQKVEMTPYCSECQAITLFFSTQFLAGLGPLISPLKKFGLKKTVHVTYKEKPKRRYRTW